MQEELKILKFEQLCGDWDYRNIDMTESHLEGISIKDYNISVSCELFSPDLDDYVSCSGGTFENKELVEKFQNLDLDNKSDVIAFIGNIESLVDWEKVNDELYQEAQKEAEFGYVL